MKRGRSRQSRHFFPPKSGPDPMDPISLTSAHMTSLNEGTMSQEDAKNILTGIRGGLRNTDGSTKSGVFMLSTAEDGSATLSTATWTPWRNDTMAASGADILQKLMKAAHGEVYTSGAEAHVTSYLTTSSAKFGSLSLAKLLDDFQAPTDVPARRETGGRLDSSGVRVRNARERVGFFRTMETRAPSDVAKAQLDILGSHLDRTAMKCFQHLTKLDRAGSVGEPPSYVLGDADGSISRMLLMGIQSGHVQLAPLELKLLAEAMNKEAQAANDGNLEGFQSDAKLSTDFDAIVKNAKFTPSANKLVFIGDIVHDRFSNNKPAMRDLIGQLHDRGAVFIKGNHDVYDECFNQGRRALRRCQVGEHGVQLPAQEARALEALFVHAHYDESARTFYSHNGFQYSPEDGYRTAFGHIQAKTPQELAEGMNATPYSAESGEFTKFRPTDHIMQTARIGPAGSTDGGPVRQVHGHNDNHGVTGNVFNLNARDVEGFAPYGAIL